MADVIYKHIQVMKFDFYQWMKDTLEANGWSNLSSRAADFDVYHSKGTSGNEELYFQMREYDTNTARKISNSAYSQLIVRALESYKPSSTSGGAGTFTPASHGWLYTHVTAKQTYTNILLDVYYYCDADKFTCVIECPSFLKYSSVHYYIGKPEYRVNGEIKKKCMVMTSQSSSVYNYQIAYHNSKNMGAYVPTLRKDMSPIPTNVDGSMFFMYQPSFYDDVEGYFCKIDGIYFITWDSEIMSHSNNSFTGHTLITPDGRRYRTTVLTADFGGGWDVYPHYAMAFRIE